MNFRLSLYLLIHIILILSLVNTNEQLTKKVVQVEPVALDIVMSVYERAVVFFSQGNLPADVQRYQAAVKKFLQTNYGQSLNKTLFAICDLQKDGSGKLKKYGGKPGIKIITGITHYQLIYPSSQEELSNFFSKNFEDFLASYLSNKAEQLPIQQLVSTSLNSYRPFVYVTANNLEKLGKSQAIYRQIYDYLHFFNVSLRINSKLQAHSKIQIFNKGELCAEYASSAVQALFNFTETPAKQEINDLVDFINIETIEDVTILNDENYYRVFGSSIQYQMLLVFRSKDIDNQQIKKVVQVYKQAAARNRKQGLKYQRVLFATGTTQLLKEYFVDSVLDNQKSLYEIIITRTDYSRFQLRKFVYESSEVSTDNILSFIEEVKLKRIEPKFKSEQIQENENKKIRKIVGKNFEREIFEQSDKSVIVLFYDSRDESYISLQAALVAFVNKYEGAIKDFVKVGTFDLAKNQHKLLTISSAPQLILFQRTNKKKPKFYKGSASLEVIKNWVNYQVKDVTIPQNYGEPPIALGGIPNNDQL